MKNAIRGKGGCDEYVEYQIMKEMGWSEEELHNCSYERYLDIRRMLSLEKKEKQRQKKRQQKSTSTGRHV